MPAPSEVAVVFGGPSPEHDVSVLTGLMATAELARQGRPTSIHPLYWSKNGAWFEVPHGLESKAFLDGPPAGARSLELHLGPEGGFVEPGRLGRQRRIELEAVLVCCHGGPGEDGSLQGAFDLADLAYSGPSAASAALGMDKLATAGILRAADVAVLPRVLLSDDTDEIGFAGPYIVKPRFGGSSIGIDVVTDLPSARARLSANVHLRRGAVLEPYRPDLFDLQVAVRTYPETELSSIERPLGRVEGGEILGYADKYVGGEGMHTAPSEIPANIPGALAARLRAVAHHAARELGCRGVNRIDFLSDGEEQLFLNEVNTVPGSLSRHLFREPPRPFADLLRDLLTEAVERPAVRFSSAGANGAVLRDAGSIAGKLG
jgi:D-alanine-D-alanine ligase